MSSTSLHDRFWSKVQQLTEDECWEWQAHCDSDGYGRIKVDGTSRLAHRVVMELDGIDVGDSHVLHHCDNPPCVNPNHLYLGDASDNMKDAYERGRKEPVEVTPSAKVSSDEASEIRSRYESEDVTQSELGDDYGLCQQAVSAIVNEVNWSKQ